MRGAPFARSKAMMALVAAAYAFSDLVSRQTALAQIGPYVSRGKGRTARHDRGGTRAYQRAALKRRNRAKHRKACRA